MPSEPSFKVINGHERRVHRRFGLNFSIRFRRLDKLIREPEAAVACHFGGTDISAGGVGGVAGGDALAGLKLAPGDKLMVEVDLEDGQDTLTTAAKVAWHSQGSGPEALQFAGFKFVLMTDEVQQRIQDLVSRAAQRGEALG